VAARRPLVIDSATGRVKELPSSDTLVGGDNWTVVKVTQDFSVTAATFADVLVVAAGAALGFTPAANTTYEVDGMLLIQTATTTVGPRPGVAWGTGYSYGGVEVRIPTSASTEAYTTGSMGTIAGTVQSPVGGLPTAAAAYLASIYACFVSGTTPTAFKVQLASETAGTSVTVKAGSFIRYRTIP
jgi:hypothetical protein